MNFYHFIWFLLPLTYIAVILKAFVKRAAKSHALEDEKNYLQHLIFCLVSFFIAVYIDSNFGKELIDDGPLNELGDTAVFRWLIYPAVLFLFASLSGVVPGLKSKKPPAAPKSRF